jgi:hypothetical protein
VTPSPTRRRGADVVPDVVLLAVALAAGLGASRLARTPDTAHVLLPIAACVVAGHAVVSAVRSLRWPDPLPSLAGVLGVALVAVWTLLPAATRGGIPTTTTVRVLLHTFSAAGTAIRANPTPVPATTGVVLCLAAGAGLAAVFARTLWSWQQIRPVGQRRPLVALFPTFGLFCYTALLSSDIDRVTGTTLYLAAALLFLAVADRPPVARHRRSWRSGTTAALAMAAMAVVVPVAASPGLAGLRLDAVPFSDGGGFAGAAGATFGSGGTGAVTGIGALSLIDNMRAILTARSNLVMFTAVTRTPTYWQVATLSHFNGNSWLPDQATQAAADDAPQLAPLPLPVLPQPAAAHNFTAHIAIGNLRSNLLPVPPSTVAVGEATNIQLEPGIGVVQPYADSADLVYDATAPVPSPLGSSPAPSVAALDSSLPPGDLAPYLAVPSSIPAAVVALAHQLVANITGPEAQATALVRYFTDDRRFRYTLTPSIDGANALSSFLFTTRAGFCQQFAGAYAVLARIDGLPTRLAIGFTTGSVGKNNTYSITGADAHSWPQVYLGPNAGWVSFEPTPATSDQPRGAGVLSGSPTTTPPLSSRPPHSTSTIIPEHHPGHATPPSPGNAKGLFGNAGSTPSTAPAGPSWGSIILLALGAIVVIVGAVVAGPWLWRRRRLRLRRRRFARTGEPGTEILARWAQAASVLDRAGLGRRGSETLEEHATRLVAQSVRPTEPVPLTFTPVPRLAPGPGTDPGRALRAYQALAALAARASYAPDPCTDADVDEARRLSDELRAALRRGPPVSGPTRTRP